MIIFFCSWSVLIIFIAIACYGGKQFGMGYAAEHKGRLSQQLLVRIFSRAAALFATGGDQGRNHAFKVGGPVPWSRLLYRTKYGWYLLYPVSCTAGCYVTVITLFVKKVGVVRPNFGGPDPRPPPPVVAPLVVTRPSWQRAATVGRVTCAPSMPSFFAFSVTISQ